MKQVEETYDVVVCGGGLAGCCAALAAARVGSRTCLIQNRPMLGGNSSSEIGVTPHGAAAFHAYARETGLLSQALIEERYRNHAEIYENGWTNSVWDMVLYDLVSREQNLTLHLNTDVVDVIMDSDMAQPDRGKAMPHTSNGYYHRPSLLEGPGRIQAVVARELNAELRRVVQGRIFIDCTGDALVADRAGCEWRMGSEGRDELGEPHAPEQPSTDTMGNSLHFQARDMGRPCPFVAPDWAIHYDDASYFYKQGRIPKDRRGGFWWLEIGIPYHTVYDNETIRHELTRHALGVWDWMKNRDERMMEATRNYALDWIGQVPGKRDSRRVMGLHFFNENEVLDKTVFPDEIAFGGWFVDLHTPGGLLAEHSEPTSADDNHNTFSDYSVLSYCGPYGLPLRSLISRDVENLLMAGRNISTSHAAFGTLRVMGTTALMGQAAGVAASLSLDENVSLSRIWQGGPIQRIQQSLLGQGCFLPNQKNQDPADLARKASITASSSARLIGTGPQSAGTHEGLGIWRDQPQYQQECLHQGRSQLIALGPEGIRKVSLFLANGCDSPQQVQAKLVQVEHIWDYRRKPSEPLARTTLDVPAGKSGWIDWPVEICPVPDLPAGCWLRVDLEANENISWPASQAILPGHMSYYQIGRDKMRRFGNGVTLSFRVDPPQSVFGPENILSGVTRPCRGVNLWRSDPLEPLDQWVELSWPHVQTIARVELTFPGHLLREYHAYGPFYVDAHVATHYSLETAEKGTWREILNVSGNYQRRRVHEFQAAVKTDRLRVKVHATGGDPSAGIYEIRCYRP